MSRRQLDTGTDELLGEVRDGVAIFTLNRPQARNALSDRLTPALRAGIAACDRPDGNGSSARSRKRSNASSLTPAGRPVKSRSAEAATRTSHRPSILLQNIR